jgi:hypothetical protein
MPCIQLLWLACPMCGAYPSPIPTRRCCGVSVLMVSVGQVATTRCRPTLAPVAGGRRLRSGSGLLPRGPRRPVPMSFVIARLLGPSSTQWQPACLQLCICGSIMFGFAFLLVGTSTCRFGVWFVWRPFRPCGRATGCCGPWSSLTCCLEPAGELWLTSGLVWTSVCLP